MTSAQTDWAGTLNEKSEQDRLYRKITWRLIPFLATLWVLAWIDRVNIGFAKLAMLNDLQFSDTVYGLGAGIFFLGYFLFEVPSNMLLVKIGARKTIARITIGWGIVSILMLFTKTPTQFYCLRFMLGVFEAGFYPGIILYLTYWFPSQRRSRAFGLFMSASAVAGIIGGPIAGLIMSTMNGFNNLHAGLLHPAAELRGSGVMRGSQVGARHQARGFRMRRQCPRMVHDALAQQPGIVNRRSIVQRVHHGQLSKVHQCATAATACGSRLLRIITRISNAPNASTAATPSKPAEIPAPESLSTPIAYGAPKPARLAMELIIATPPAAAAPETYMLGNCQNTGIALMVPNTASVSATKARSGLCVTSAVTTMAVAPINAPAAQCKLFLPLLSARKPLPIMPMAPKI